MDLDAEVAKSRKTLTRLGIWGTALFVGLIVGYIYWKGGPAKLWDLPFNSMGDFFAGAFAPLAFWWLVIGYWMQSLELEHNSKEMRNAVEQAAKQAEAAQANERYQRQSVINQTRQKYEDDLAILAAEISVLYFKKNIDSIWGKYSSGDKTAFVRELRDNIYRNEPDWVKILESAPSESMAVVSIKAREYIVLFDDFIRVLSEICPNNFFSDYYMKSEFGYLRTDLAGMLEGES